MGLWWGFHVVQTKEWPTIVCTPCSHTGHGHFNAISISVEKPPLTTPVQRQSLRDSKLGEWCKGCLRLLGSGVGILSPILIWTRKTPCSLAASAEKEVRLRSEGSWPGEGLIRLTELLMHPWGLGDALPTQSPWMKEWSKFAPWEWRKEKRLSESRSLQHSPEQSHSSEQLREANV